MIRISIEGHEPVADVSRLLRGAVESKIRRVRLGIEATEGRLQALEQRHGKVSAEVLPTLTAEDLVGGDLDSVEWMGEWRMLHQLKEDLRQLEAIEYADR